MVRSGLEISKAAFRPYHSGKSSRKRNGKRAPEDKDFIAWDGEGMTFSGAHHYVLFGNSTGQRITIHDYEDQILRSERLLNFIVNQGIANPDCYHVGFAFGYDSNMLIRTLPGKVLYQLHKSAMGYVRWKEFGITYRKGKWFQVTRYQKDWDRKTNPHAQDTTRIYDLFSFFACSFVKAVEDLLGDDYPNLDLVKAGKAERSQFSLDEWPFMEEYWEYEIAMLKDLADELRDRLYSAGLTIQQWHGPGALASFAMGQNNIKAHMAKCYPEVRTASRHAYAGGRFELFMVGRIEGPIYQLDLNSAYPAFIAQLPSLTAGQWRHVINPSLEKLQRFGVYRVSLHASAGFDLRPGPFFHRDRNHNISFPWVNDTWVWAPEIHHFRVHTGRILRIMEGWEYVGYTGSDLPFRWVREMYDTRAAWKRNGNPAQLALKLCMNSIYGKLAQRVGWDEGRNRMPPWHQLEWAGWVTSSTRAQLYSVMKRIPQEDLIGVETDGIYTTRSPESLNLSHSDELGSWGIDEWDEILYLQSGLYFLRRGGQWKIKFRGLDRDSFSVRDAIEYVKSLGAHRRWESFSGKTTRFVGLGAALARNGPIEQSHCKWETTEREITPGESGKRIHFPLHCRACQLGLNAYDMAHDLCIRSVSTVGEMSTPHYIPWESRDEVEPEWFKHAEMEDHKHAHA